MGRTRTESAAYESNAVRPVAGNALARTIQSPAARPHGLKPPISLVPQPIPHRNAYLAGVPLSPTMTRMLSGTFCGRDAEKDSRALGSLDAQHPLDQFGVDRS